MLPIAEVMDKMPLFGDVVTRTAVLFVLLAAGVAWSPVVGTPIVLVGAIFVPWFHPATIAMFESFEPLIMNSIRREDPTYFAFARSIPWMLLGAWLIGFAIWLARRRLRARREP